MKIILALKSNHTCINVNHTTLAELKSHHTCRIESTLAKRKITLAGKKITPTEMK